MPTTRRFRALAHDFAVRGQDPDLVRYLDELFAPFAVTGLPVAWYELTNGDDGHALAFDGELLLRSDEPADAVGMLLWHVNRQVVERSDDLVRLHAAAASLGGRAVLLPAAMEAGKTTLVAGLLRAGFDYLSDEVAALQPSSLDVLAYPKALSVDEGSWRVLGDLEPVIDEAVAACLPRQWQVPAESIRNGAVAYRARPRFVVFPNYESDAASELAPLGGADATVRLARCTFEFERQPDRDLKALARLAEQTDCFELRVGNLEDACRLVLDLYASTDKE